MFRCAVHRRPSEQQASYPMDAEADRHRVAGARSLLMQHPRKHRVRRQLPRGVDGRDNRSSAQGKYSQLHRDTTRCKPSLLDGYAGNYVD